MIQVREYATLTTDSSASKTLDMSVISHSTYDWLLEVSQSWRKGGKPILVGGHKALKLGSYVGYLKSPSGEEIEIIPKTELGQENVTESRQTLRKMLAASLNVSPNESGEAHLQRMEMPLHEWIYSRFLGELRKLVSRGIRFEYERVQEHSRFLSGQLNVAAQIRLPPGKHHEFVVRHDIFSPNHLENRLIRTALGIVSRNCKHSDNWRLSNELMHQLEIIEPISNPKELFSKWRGDRLMQTYQPIKPWCQLIIDRLNPNFQKGQHRGIALLFPMERLFENYVSGCLKTQLQNGCSIKVQSSSEYLVKHQPCQTSSLQSWFQLRPDLLLLQGGGRQVVDIKWKLINESNASSDSKYGMSQSDLYQMFSYGHKYQNGKGHIMLIYPKHEYFSCPLPVFEFDPDFRLWAVPFDLKAGVLVPGLWGPHFAFEDRSLNKCDAPSNLGMRH